MKLPKPRYTVTADKRHRYTILDADGSEHGPLISVTTVLNVLAKEALIGWAAREAANHFKTELINLGRAALTVDTLERIAKDAAGAHRRKAKDAADIGTKCHEAFEAVMRGKEPKDMPPEIAGPVQGFKEWRLQSDFEIVDMEIATGSLAYNFGGRIDTIGWSPSRGFGILDQKTSSGFYGNEYAYQVAGYAIALEEQYGIQISWAEIARFSKKEPFESEVRPISALLPAKEAFINALRVSIAQKIPMIGPAIYLSTPAPAPNAKSKDAAATSEAGF